MSLVLVAFGVLVSSAEAGPPGPDPVPGQALSAYGRLPLNFVANLGQTASRAPFVVHGGDHTLFVGPTETVFVAQPPPPGLTAVSHLRGPRRAAPAGDPTPERPPRAIIHMRLLGADPSAVMMGEERISSVNYLIGSDRSKWRTNVPAYARVRSPGVYPGVDLVFYGRGRQFEFDFVVAPGTDPRSIRLGFDGIPGPEASPALDIDGRGDLVMRTTTGALRLRKPLAYQELRGGRRPVAARYVVRTASGFVAEGRPEIGIEVGAYDPSEPLVIDPVLDYSTYLGGSGNDAGMAIAVDATGHAYVAGYTESPDFPAATGPSPTGGARKVFVAKLNPAGTALVYATYLGGDGSDMATSIAVDAAGKVYVTGQTDSTDFPTTANARWAMNQGGTDAFVTKLDATGSTIEYSSYLGGAGSDAGLGVAAGSAANPRIYVTGYTESADWLPTTLLGPGGGADAFVVKLNPFAASGPTSLDYLTRLGGAGRDEAHAIAVNPLGHAHITGFTESDAYPTTAGPFQLDRLGTDAFVTKLNEAGDGLLYSTYLGGAGTDVGLGIALDSAGIYVTGHTDSADFPKQIPFQSSLQGGADAFLTKLDPGVPGSISLLYSTYLGGGGEDAGLGVAAHSSGTVYITGYTDSTNFPMLNAPQANQGGRDAFVVKLKPGAAAPLVYSTYVGGSGRDEAYGIAVDAAGSAYISGLTQSDDFPAVEGFGTMLGGSQDAFVAKLTAGPDLIVSSLSAIASGATVTVTETTKNQGELDTTTTSITRFYLSFDAVLDPEVDKDLGFRIVPALGAGATSSAVTRLTVPAATPGGSYVLIAQANAGPPPLPEVDGSNNTAVTASGVEVGPDLIVASLDVPGNLGTLSPGTQFTVRDITRNARPAPAGTSTTRFYLVTGTILDGGEVSCTSATAPPCFLGSRLVRAFTTTGTDPPPTNPGTELTLPNMAGTFRIIAKADADNAVAEANEANNVSVASAAFTMGPDLVVTLDVPGVVGNLPAGAPFVVKDWTRNDHDHSVSAGPSTTRFYLVTATPLICPDAGCLPCAPAPTPPCFLGSRPVPALLPSTTDGPVETTLTLPALAGGTFRIVAKADADNAVAESNEANNVSGASAAFTMGPDLVVTLDLPGQFHAVAAGAAISIADFTKNDGLTWVDSSTTKFFLSSITNPAAGFEFLGSRRISDLNPGVTDADSTPLTLPTLFGGVEQYAGMFRVTAVADADNLRAETSEANNVAVSSPIAVGPDLTISGSSAPATTRVGATITVSDFTKNRGAGNAPASTTSIYLSADAVLDADDVLLPGSRGIRSLLAGEHDSESTAVVIPATIAAGCYFIIVAADGPGTVGESDETNNALARPIVITRGPGITVPCAHPRHLPDFNGDGKADILWRQHDSGLVYVWLLDGTSISSTGSLGGVGLDWTIQDVGDFNGDGTTDIIWRHSSGLVYIWLMARDGTSISSTGSLGSVGLDWTIQGVGDVNGDGRADIIWRNSTSGLVYVWLLDGLTVVGQGSVGATSPDWVIQGVGDVNGDGRADIIWRNSTSGLVYVWLLDGLTVVGQGSVGATSPDWVIQGVGDVNGDGRADIIWRNSTSGLVYVWLLAGLTVVGQGSVGASSADWVIQGVGDVKANGGAEILWRNTTSGEVHVWLVNGTAVTGQGSPGQIMMDWQIQ